MKVLITGGTGLLGINLAGLSVTSGDDVTIASRGVTKYTDFPKDVKTLFFDMIDKNKAIDFIKEFDIVYHFAALIPHHGKENISENEIWQSNVTLTENVLNAAIKNGIPKIVFSSSMTVYDSNNDSPVNENMVLSPITKYAQSKKTAETLVQEYSKDGRLKSLIIRYPGLYGYPRENGFIYNTIKQAMHDEDIFVKTKNLGFWETMHVSDASSLTYALVKKWDWGKNCETFNCSYGEEIDIVKTAQKIKNLLGSSSKITVEQPIGYKKFYMDNKKLKRYVNPVPGFELGIKRFIDENKKRAAK